MAVRDFISTHLLTHRNGGTTYGSFKQGWVGGEPNGTGTNGRNCAHVFWDTNELNAALNGMIIDEVRIIVQGTTAYGIQTAYGFYLYKSPFGYSASNGSRLEPQSFYPANSFVNPDGSMVGGYLYSAEMARSATVNYETIIPIDFLNHIRYGKGLCAYRRTSADPPVNSHFTRETTNPIVLRVTYRASTSTFTLNSENIEAGQTLIASINRADPSYTHMVNWGFGGLNHSETGIATESAFAFPYEWLTQIPNALTGVGACTVSTYYGATLIGTASKTFVVHVPQHIVPVIHSVTDIRINGEVPAHWNMYVKNKSQVRIVTNAGGAYGSNITSISINGGGFSGSGADYTTPLLQYAGTNTFTCVVTDSRGRTNSSAIAIGVWDYENPSISNVAIARCNAAGAVDVNGSYILAAATFTTTALAGLNSYTARAYYKEKDSGTWLPAGGAPMNSGQNVVFGDGQVWLNKTIEVRIGLYDYFTGYDYISYLATANIPFEFGKDGTAFGMYGTKPNRLQINPNWMFCIGERDLPFAINQNFFINPDLTSWTRYPGRQYTGVPTGYLPDRWFVLSTNGGVQNVIQYNNERRGLENATGVPCVIYHFMLENDKKFLHGKVVTMTICTNGNEEHHTYTFDGNPKNSFQTPWMGQYVLYPGSVLNYAKLELGNAPTDFVPPVYADELAKTNYYYKEISGDYAPIRKLATEASYIVKFDEMRTIPAVTTLSAREYNAINYTLTGRAVQVAGVYKGHLVLSTSGISVPDQTFLYIERLGIDAEIY